MNGPAVSMISLGCAKNLVDSEGMLGALTERGGLVAADPRDADVLLINTCGFIEEARAEAFDTVTQALRMKEAGRVRAVIVVGCLVQLMRERLAEKFPAVDAWLGLTDPATVAEACERVAAGASESILWVPDPSQRPLDAGPRLRVTPKHFAYLRIAEGCDNRCHYCLIPSIRGPLRSKPEERTLAEARELIADGARELIVIAQDTTNYGLDLYGERRLPALLRELRELDGVRWLRLLYTHPAHFDDELIRVLAEGGPVLPYVDLPVQHANDAILARMGRGIDRTGLRELIGDLRSRVPGAVLRSSVIVGFPGEGEAAFRDLLDFVREVRFERLGAFAYSREAGTPAADLDGQVPPEAKAERLDAVMELQHEIATEQSEELVGREVAAVVDGRGPDGEWAGRTVRDAPDVDGTIRFREVGLRAGLFCRARVTEAYGCDLVGSVVGPAEAEGAEDAACT